jgi:DNA polymerase (family 10)
MGKTRRILKKGRFIITKKGRFVLNLSNKIVKSLKPYCKKIQIVGSIRRKEKNPVDVDITLIPKNNESKKKIENNLRNKGRFVQGGEKRATFRIKGVKIELYYTTEDSWGATLLAYSSRFGAGIGLRIVARKKGFKLNQYGLFRGNKKVAGKTEEEIYHALGREWKSPELR